MNKLLLLLSLSFAVFSADLHLFNSEGEFNSDFANQIISGDLKPDEFIHLKNRVVTYKSKLGSGNTTMILRVQDHDSGNELALRLPYGNPEKNFSTYDGQRFIDYSYNGFKDLEETSLPIPKIHAYHESSYLLVDIVEHDFTLRHFLVHNELYDNEVRERIASSLIQFAKDSAIYEQIGDFHLEQLVYSTQKNKWFLLDWTDNHQLARLPSSPKIFSSFLFSDNNIALDEEGNELFKLTENGQKVKIGREVTDFEMQTLEKLNKAIEEQRRIQQEIDEVELEKLLTKLKGLDDYSQILQVYEEVKTTHLGSFFTMLQKDFVSLQLPKFPKGVIKQAELELLFENLGKFNPYFFSQFTEKVMTNISNLETFMVLYKRIEMIGLDEDLEDDVAIAISRNIERILTDTTTSPEVLDMVHKLKGSYGLINYKTKEILTRADELLRPSQNCHNTVLSFMRNAE